MGLRFAGGIRNNFEAMKIQELRIGNWFIGYNGKPFQWSLGHFGLLTLKKNRPEIDDIIKSPIPLTEEILLKCGFDENMVLSTIEGEIRYYGDGDINIGGEDSCTLGMVYIAKCKYLHQLQNLYFALTGKELEVEL